jgi:transposase
MAEVTTRSSKSGARSGRSKWTLGIDLGDQVSIVCGLEASTGEVKPPLRIPTTREGLTSLLKPLRNVRVVIETGTHSNWVAREVERLGHEVIVAQSRKLHLISKNERKSDVVDATLLAELGAVRPSLLCPVKQRSEQAQVQLAVIRLRELAVQSRTAMITAVRGTVKSFGYRLPACSADAFHRQAWDKVPAELERAVRPMLLLIARATRTIRRYDREVLRIAREERREALRLAEVGGVGILTSLAYVVAIDDPERFRSSRRVGPYFGLVPGRDQSGALDKKLGITKCGDDVVRRLLVQCAHVILSGRAGDSTLKRFGDRILERGGKNAKRRAVVAVARKLAVLLHALWRSGEAYEPLRAAA